ncbi:MAG: hypothetical protein Q7U65_04055, partial [Bacteroidota bacterium]|nr:hypothetical protein [Bacteroidota bacterium]
DPGRCPRAIHIRPLQGKEISKSKFPGFPPAGEREGGLAYKKGGLPCSDKPPFVHFFTMIATSFHGIAKSFCATTKYFSL